MLNLVAQGANLGDDDYYKQKAIDEDIEKSQKEILEFLDKVQDAAHDFVLDATGQNNDQEDGEHGDD